MLLQSVHSRLESWALDDPEQCGAKVKANKSWILCLLQEGSGRRGKAIKVNCQSSLAKGTRQLNGLENVSYVSLPLDSISVRLLGKARQMFMQFNFSSKGELSRGVCVCMCSSVCICFTGIFGFCLLNSGQVFLCFTQIPVKHLLATKCVCVQQVCMCMHVRVHVCYAALKLYAFLKFSLVETLLVATKWITCSSWKHFQGRGRAECQAYQMCSESVHNCADEVCIWCLIWKIMNGATHATNRAQSEQFMPRLESRGSQR